MQTTGLLILTSPMRTVVDNIGNHLTLASKHVSKKLYVKLEPGQEKLHPLLKRQTSDLKSLFSFIPALYTHAAAVCNDVDVRLLLTSFKNASFVEKHLLSQHIDLALTDASDSASGIKQYINEQFRRSCLYTMKLDKGNVDSNPEEETSEKVYDTVVLGGTFDRLHNGHKILLSMAAARTKRRLVVGVTDGAMLKRKQLWELIEPLPDRVNSVIDFLKEIDATIEVSIVPIYDPFGPSIEDPDMDCIMVSSETERGGILVNEERQKRNMKPLEIIVVDLLEEPQHVCGNEIKISSSNRRKEFLGRPLKSTTLKSYMQGPVYVALIGGPMSGKTVMLNYMKSFNIGIIDTYNIVSQVIASMPTIFEQLKQLGPSIMELNGNINIKALNLLTLKDPQKKDFVKGIILPAVKECVEARILNYRQLEKGGPEAIVVKIHEMLQGEWHHDFYHVWISLMPEQQRIKKLKDFYGISDEEAELILNSQQVSNSIQLKSADVVLSPQWDENFSKIQIRRALENLKVHRIDASL